MAFDDSIKGGSTSKIIEVMLRDSTTGAGKTGVAFGSVTASYTREGGTRTAITLASGAAGDAYSSGKWAEVDSTNCKGLYQLHVPNAAIAAGVQAVTINLQATGVIDKAVRIKLRAVDVQDGVHFGLSCLPNTAVTTNASLLTSGTGADQIGVDGAGNANANLKQWLGSAPLALSGGYPQVDLERWKTATPNALISGRVDVSVGAMAAAAVQAIWDALTSALTTVGSVGKRIADFLTGDAFARLGAPAGASIAADVAANQTSIAAVKTQTDKIGTNSADSPNEVTTQGRVDVAVSTRLAAASYTAPLTTAQTLSALTGGTNTLNVDVNHRVDVGRWLGNAAVADSNNYPAVAVYDWANGNGVSWDAASGAPEVSTQALIGGAANQILAAVTGGTNTIAVDVNHRVGLATADETLLSNLAAMISGSGTNAKYTVPALSNAPAGGGGGGGITKNITIEAETIQVEGT